MKKIFEPKFYKQPIPVMFLKDYDGQEKWLYGVAYEDCIIVGRNSELKEGLVSIPVIFENWSNLQKISSRTIECPLLEIE